MKIKNVVIGETYKLKPVEKRKRGFGGNYWTPSEVKVIRKQGKGVCVEDSNLTFWIPAQWLKKPKTNIGKEVFIGSWENCCCVVKNERTNDDGSKSYFCGINLDYDGGQWAHEHEVKIR